MSLNATPSARLNRRVLLSAASSSLALAAGGLFGLPLRAQEAPAPQPAAPVVPEAQPEAPVAAPQQFSFDWLTEEMRLAATKPHVEPENLTGFLGELKYDDYRSINFLAERSRWVDTDSMFRVQAFHLGWLFGAPVRLFDITDGTVQEMKFSTDDFEYRNGLAERVAQHVDLPGVAGFRMNFPLNRPDVSDELVAFLGASYFRALGRGNGYGISARGLAINTATASPEEFPRFSRFYFQRPGAGDLSAELFAAMESPSVTGAYRIVITPGIETVMEVTARLFFRSPVAQLGVAPLTSMFLFGEKNRASFDDFRPNVHDSDGLAIRRADGDTLWRPLNNPPRLASSYFGEENIASFGLLQRKRAFEDYQDAEAHYERRPSVAVEPIGQWGKGVVRLVEIPTKYETNDNIVAFWVPEGQIAAGDAREFAYRLRWGALPVEEPSDLAHIHETRAGHGGVSGTENDGETRKFVIDFKGGLLGSLPPDAEIEAIASVQHGQIVTQTLERLDDMDIWRLVLDVAAPEGATVELAAHIAGYGRKLSETWLYQWNKA
ncbi:glucan biosynthesis protein G [Cereibacter sphaeroides]|uniref:glucan biosynthesis protein n=1 Tax=Cereibacter sphaeroides TaxID=1063 RepID=UPI001F445608|nr:glucan biosynthesis protein G [Cereibacter sphaeroides]MCE6953057.1 glucan biosynthesis protein G [Cereibacter sphaeroides]MCE6961844.1 glucan biosynthesis protein G [Cereibacter sphaeroides]MCE6970619.1 glucan biosynthesis protein G [Cereibacter sphaeroides]MCE6975785.1 glucan biosynthesis protein G [Cereibacter sphaeroides]